MRGPQPIFCYLSNLTLTPSPWQFVLIALTTMLSPLNHFLSPFQQHSHALYPCLSLAAMATSPIVPRPSMAVAATATADPQPLPLFPRSHHCEASHIHCSHHCESSSAKVLSDHTLSMRELPMMGLPNSAWGNLLPSIVDKHSVATQHVMLATHHKLNMTHAGDLVVGQEAPLDHA